MKKKKRSLKKLTLNKNVVSNLERQQTQGGAPVSLVVVCPINTRWNCPIDTWPCPIDTRICPTNTRLGCPVDTLPCPIDTRICPPVSIACPIDTIL